MGTEVHLVQCYQSNRRENEDNQRPDHEGHGSQLGLSPLPISYTGVFQVVLTSDKAGDKAYEASILT